MALKPPIHGRDHCPGGADDIPCLGSTAALYDWDWSGNGNLVTTGTWTSVAGGSGGDTRFYTTSFVRGNWGTDFDSGQIVSGSGGVIGGIWVASGTVTFSGGVDSDDTLMLGVNFGSTRYPFSHIARDNTYFTVSGTVMEIADINTFPISLSVWHNHGSSITIAAARLHAYFVTLTGAGETTTRP